MPFAAVDRDRTRARRVLYIRSVPFAKRSGEPRIDQVVRDALENLGFRQKLVRLPARTVPRFQPVELRRAILVRYHARRLPEVVELVCVAPVLLVRHVRRILLVRERIPFQYVLARAAVDRRYTFLRRTVITDFYPRPVDGFDLRQHVPAVVVNQLHTFTVRKRNPAQRSLVIIKRRFPARRIRNGHTQLPIRRIIPEGIRSSRPVFDRLDPPQVIRRFILHRGGSPRRVRDLNQVPRAVEIQFVLVFIRDRIFRVHVVAIRNGRRDFHRVTQAVFVLPRVGRPFEIEPMPRPVRVVQIIFEPVGRRCTVIAHIYMVIRLQVFSQIRVRRRACVGVIYQREIDRHQIAARAARDRLGIHQVAVVVVDSRDARPPRAQVRTGPVILVSRHVPVRNLQHRTYCGSTRIVAR